MIRTKIFNNNGNFSKCIVLGNDKSIIILCGDYLLVFNSIKELWNKGENPRSYISEIARRINRDKAWVMRIVDKLVKEGVVTRYMMHGYKRKAFYKPSENFEQYSIKKFRIDNRDYRLVDLALLISTSLIAYQSYLSNNVMLISIWAVMITLIELILHYR